MSRPVTPSSDGWPTGWVVIVCSWLIQRSAAARRGHQRCRLSGGTSAERMTDASRAVVACAAEEARVFGQELIGIEHLLAGLCCDEAEESGSCLPADRPRRRQSRAAKVAREMVSLFPPGCVPARHVLSEGQGRAPGQLTAHRQA